MSDVQHEPNWWLASDGKWYPPQQAPSAAPIQLPPPPAPISSDQQIAADWWLASDGRWYPPKQVQQAVYTPSSYFHSVPAKGRRTLPYLLVGLLQVFYWLGALASVIALGFALDAYAKLQDYWDTPVGSRAEFLAESAAVEAYDNLRVSMLVVSLSTVVVFIFLLIWANLSNKACRHRWHGPRKWGSGWAVSSWFIPVVNLFLPKVILNETERIGAAAKENAGLALDGWQQRPVSALGSFWFCGLVIGIVLIPLGQGFIVDQSDLIWSGYIVLSIGLGIQALAYILGSMYTGKVSKYFN